MAPLDWHLSTTCLRPSFAMVIVLELACLVLAAFNMAAESSHAAALDRGHDLELAEAHMPGIGLTPCRSEVAEDIRDFESGTDHEDRLIPADQTFCWSAV